MNISEKNDCILCGKCLSVCPLVRATDREELGPRSKSHLLNTLLDDAGKLTGEQAAKLARLCLGCERCKAVCTRHVDVPGLVAAVRAANPNFKEWLWKTWLTKAKLLWPVGSKAAQFVPDGLEAGKLGPMLKMLAGLKGGPGIEPFLTPRTFPETHRGERMLLFPGCTATYLQGRWLVAALKLLDGLGVDLVNGDFGCCGHGLKLAGIDDQARAMAERNVAAWRQAGKPKIVAFCASCMAGLSAYGPVFVDDVERRDWENSLIWLSDLAQDIEFVISDNAPESIGFHRPCHDTAGRDHRFMARVLGDRLVAATDKECCGFGGITRLSIPEPADAVNAQCWQRLHAASLVLTGCAACAAQLTGTVPAHKEAAHWLETIA